jgi:hypothetical protein
VEKNQIVEKAEVERNGFFGTIYTPGLCICVCVCILGWIGNQNVFQIVIYHPYLGVRDQKNYFLTFTHDVNTAR